MNLQSMLYFSSILLTCLLTGFLAWYAWRQPAAPGVRAYAILALSECLMALTDVISILSGTQAQALFWFDLRFLFTASIPVIFLGFVMAYGGQKSWLTKKLLAGALVIPVITQVLLWSNSLHGLWVKQEVTFHPYVPFWIVDTSTRIPGAWFLVHLFYSQLLMLAGMVLIFLTAWRVRRQHHGQAALLIAGAMVGLISSLIPTFNLIPQLKFNPFIPGIGVSALLYALAIFRFHFLRPTPLQENPSGITHHKPQEKGSLATLILVFILFTSGMAATSYWTYQNYQKQFRTQVDSQLSAIADLKVSGLENWRNERLSNAEGLYQNPAFTSLVQSFLQKPEDLQPALQLQVWLDSFQTGYEYERVFLLDRDGVERLSSPAAPEPVTPYLTQEAAAVLAAGQVTFLDLHRDAADSPIHLTLLVPVFAEQDPRRPLGVLVLRIDPQLYLYPYLQRWPVPSASAETLLVRRDAEQVVYLNELRFAPGSAMSLGAPLTETSLPAVQAVLLETGSVEGIDYRGQRVIADLRAVPDSPWFLVSKMDTDEVFAPLRARLWQTMLFFSMLILAAAAGLLFIWRQQRMRYYRSQLETMAALRLSEEKYRLAFDTSPDSISITRLRDGMFVSVNKGFEQISGYTRKEALGKTSAELNIWKDLEDQRNVVRELRATGELLNYEAPFLTRNGERHGSLSAAIIELNGEAHILNITRDISARKQAEGALHESEEHLRLAVMAGRMGTWDRNFVSGQLSWSPKAKALFGLAPEIEMNDERFMNALHPEDRASTDLDVREALEKKTDFNAEYRTLWPDNTLHWISAHGRGYYNEAGQAIRMVGVVFDITERKRVEQALREREEFQRALLENAPVSIYVTSVAGHLRLVNQTWETDTARPRTEVLGRALEEIFSTATARKYRADNEKVLATGKSIEFEEVVEATNEQHHYYTVKFPLLDAHGQVEAVGGISIDITERKQAESMLQKRLELLEFATSHSLDELLVKTLDDVGELTASPIGFYHFVDSDQQTLSLQAWSTRTRQEFFKSEGQGLHIPVSQAGIWADCVLTQKPVIHNHYASEELSEGLPEGHVLVLRELVVPILRSSKIVAILGIGNKPVEYTRKDIEIVSYFADIAWESAERKQADEILKSYSVHLETEVQQRTRDLHDIQEKLVRQERLAVLGQLAGSVGHELRNPLGVISNAAYFLQLTQPETSEKVREYLQIIDSEVRTAEKIITDLLDFSRIKSLVCEPVDVSQLVEKTLGRYPAPANVSVRRQIRRDLPHVFADAQQMGQVLGNLLMNAYQAMEGNGKVTITAKRKADMVAISVADSGPGISPENMHKLFEPLFTTKLRGIGLGLALSQRFAQANGGLLEVQSEAGKGSTFTVYIPIQKKVTDE